ncbi:MAG: double-strand break repair helicase AddA [Methylocella sp.]
MALFNVPQHTLEKQRQASDPTASVWVSAHAGSGKTHVLAQRVVRLLLQGVAPSKILCLTFTKAAAANMATRVFDTLAKWTRLDDAELRKAIVATGAPEPREREKTAARKLFARTVETPGGLKIQTIHAFCEKLLHLFPFEANAPARFDVADEFAQAQLLEHSRREVLAQAMGGHLAIGDALQRVSDECSGGTFESLIKEALRHRAMSRARWPQDPEPLLRKALSLAPGRGVAAITRDMIEHGVPPERWSELAAFFDQGGVNNQKKAKLFRQAASHHEDGDLESCLEFYLSIFFTKTKSERAKTLVNQTLAKQRPDIVAELFAEQERLDPLRGELKSAETLERTLALVAVVDAIFRRYEAMKAVRGILDFDDLVAKTLGLLERSEAAWVLYKLDAGIDHILVDEAQDTSAAQWQILERLTEDFAVGSGRSAAARTFFAVGDEKQSIFSFQGAAPHMFAEMRGKFARRFTSGAETFADVRLTQSFRSAPGVLEAVDKVFELREHQSGLIDNDVWVPHEALKQKLPGLIEIWPSIGAQAREDARDWKLPLDILDEMNPASLIARRIAQKIAQLVADDSSECVHDSRDGTRRKISAGDILILVRTRGPFFDAVIRALKQNKVPVAGADRLELTGHIAVLDLVAAGRAALLPQDDLVLASVLKSPLIGLDDDDLLAIAPKRSGSLIDALRGAPAAHHAQALDKVNLWRTRAAQSPFEFYSSLLNEDGGRRAMAARLGPEATDAIDEFLRLALAHEAEAAPSLAGFLAEFEAMERSIKRDMESGVEVVRVMTVHAAKGLEAKIVFLPDTCGAPSPRHDPNIFALNAGSSGAVAIAWSPRKAADCPAITEARDAAREASLDEYRRLLYVALTRAEERLYIAGFHGVNAPDENCWAAMIQATLASDRAAVAAPAFWSPDESVLRLISAGEDAVSPAAPSPEPAAPVAEKGPDWLWRRVDPESEPAPPVRPSSALAAADQWGDASLMPARREALRIGELTHVLLQYLPDVAPDRRREAAHAFLQARANDLDEKLRSGLIAAALGVIEAPELGSLFGPGSKAEVAVAGAALLPRGGSVDVLGRIDRIGETADEILIADYKTGAPCALADIPARYIAQMALYRAVLAPLWPEKRLRLMLIWTAKPLVVDLDDASLDAALASIPAQRRLDASGAPSYVPG